MKRVLLSIGFIVSAYCGYGQIEINSTNNVGIGIAPTTTERLLVSNGALKIGNSSSATERAKNMIKIGDGSFIQIGEWEADDMLSFKANRYNFTNGNVGIGLTNNALPAQKLHVVGNSYFDGNIGIGISNTSYKLQVEGNSFINGNSYFNGNIGMGIASNAEAKLLLQAANKYSMYLTNTGITEGSPLSIGTTYGIYTRNTGGGYSGSVFGLYADNSISGTYGGNLYGIYMNNARQSGYSGNLHGIHLENICNTETGQIYGISINTESTNNIPVYGIYSMVSGGGVTDTYSGYFTGGKVLVDNDLHVTNNLWVNNMQITSDERLKSNIKPLSNEMNKLYQLQGKSYQKAAIVVELQDSLSIALRAENKREPLKDVTEFGYLAQDVQKIFPELVSQDEATGYYAVNYIGLIPVMVEALKEQRLENEQKQVQIDKLQEMIQTLNAKIEKLETIIK